MVSHRGTPSSWKTASYEPEVSTLRLANCQKKKQSGRHSSKWHRNIKRGLKRNVLWNVKQIRLRRYRVFYRAHSGKLSVYVFQSALRNDDVNCQDDTELVTDEWMSLEHRWNDTAVENWNTGIGNRLKVSISTTNSIYRVFHDFRA